jgi:alkyl sulfatase BDS1-like metallo-beta-lactamase superfamily hydrolase
MFGGEEKVLDAAEEALLKGDALWSLELSSHVWRLHRWNERANTVRMKALQNLASKQTNPLARNHYMTSALDQCGLIDWRFDMSPIVRKLPLSDLLNFMRYRLMSEHVEGVNMTIVLNFTDVKEVYAMRIVYSVLRVDQLTSPVADYDAKVTTTSAVWRKIINKETSPVWAYLSGGLAVDGGLLTLRRFMSYSTERFKFQTSKSYALKRNYFQQIGYV